MECVQIGDCTLYRADCLDVLRDLPAGGVNCVITDPPFGVRDDVWDDMDAREFARFSMAWLAAARRVGKELISFCSAYGPFRQLCEMLWPRVRVMVWDKPIGSQYAGSSERGLWFAFETILHCHTPITRTYVEPKSLRLGQMLRDAREAAGISRGAVDVAVRGKKTGLCYRWEEGACLPTPEQVDIIAPILRLNGTFQEELAAAYADRDWTLAKARAGASETAAEGRDVFSYRTETESDHPCQKPLPLLRDLLEYLTPLGCTILDPFMGSGTTGIACLRTGRKFIGVEIDPTYFEVAVKRIRAELESTPLFDALEMEPATLFAEE